MKEYFFLGGLPRSGSTLLCNIFAQNNKFHVSKCTSGLHSVLTTTKNNWSNIIEHKAEGIDFERLKRCQKSILASYYNTDKNIIIDKSRNWIGDIEMLEFILDKKAKIIAPVREVREILASFEALYRKMNAKTQWNFRPEDLVKSKTTEGRCDIWSAGNDVVGFCFNQIKDALTKGQSDRILFMEMDALTHNPEYTMQKIYEFMEKEYFQHDFNNVEQYTKEDDLLAYNIEGLHDIRSKVEPVPKKAYSILGEFLYNKYANQEIWRNN
jgi:sulfotransferase